MSRCRESSGASLGSQMTPPAESSSGKLWASIENLRKSVMVASRRTSASLTNGGPYTPLKTMWSPPMCTVLAGLRACTSNSRGALATCSSTKSGSSLTVCSSTVWPAWRNSSTASGFTNWMPISETIRRQPRSRISTASGERSSYRAILLTNIATSFHADYRSLDAPGREPYTHIVELCLVTWNKCK